MYLGLLFGTTNTVTEQKVELHHSAFLARYRIAGIFNGAKFSRRPLWLYYSNYSRVNFRAAVVPRKISPFAKTKD